MGSSARPSTRSFILLVCSLVDLIARSCDSFVRSPRRTRYNHHDLYNPKNTSMFCMSSPSTLWLRLTLFLQCGKGETRVGESVERQESCRKKRKDRKKRKNRKK